MIRLTAASTVARPTSVAFVARDSGILAPGRWRWLRATAWMLLLFGAASALLYPGWLARAGIDPGILRIATTALAYLGYAGAVRWCERRRPVEIALRRLLPELIAGFAIGAGMFALVFASLMLMHVYTMTPATWNDWPHDLIETLRTGFAEELLIRLIVFRLLVRIAGVWPALIVSALLFGALHLTNPNASIVAALAIAIEAGLMLAAFYLLTGRIWMSVGVHAAWNWAQGSVFGARVSGHGDSGSLFVSAPLPGAPDILSGGAFGPEASLSAMLVGLAVFLVVMRRRNL